MRRPSLNHAYRLVWNHVTQAFVPVAETARGRGKSAGRKALVEAIGGALLALGAGSALATPVSSCDTGGGFVNISTTEATTCNLTGGKGLTISGSGGISLGASATGVTVSNSTAGIIINSGTISAPDGRAVYVTSSSTVNGSITNNGTMISDKEAIKVDSNSNVIGRIANNGSISGLAGIVVDSGTVGGTVGGGLFNDGSITADQTGIGVISGSILGGIANTGTISSANSTGLLISGSGSLVTGNISNSGTISAHSDGIRVDNGASVAGSIGNSGSITANFVGIGVIGATVDGDLINSNTGVLNIGEDDVSDASGLSVQGGSVNNVINNGRVSVQATSSGAALYVAQSSVASITNNGTLTGTGADSIAGLMVTQGQVSGNIVNTGLISASSTGTFDGNVAGLGLIGSSLGGDLVNSGTITSTGFGVAVIGSPSVSGTFRNSGLIVADQTGVMVMGSGFAGGIVNSGTIAGGNHMAMVLNGFVPTLTIEGNDTARFIGTVYATNTEVIVAPGATYTMRGEESFLVDDDGGFTNKGTLGVAAGATGNITGDYTQIAGAVFRTQVGNDTTYGKLVVQGTATLPSNAQIDVKMANRGHVFSASSLNGIIEADTLITNGFAKVTDDSFLFDFVAVQNDNRVDLNLVKVAQMEVVAAQAGNSPARGVARLLDRLLSQDTNPALVGYYGSLGSADETNDALTQSLPLLVGASQTAAANVLGNIGSVLQSRLGAGRGQSSGELFFTEGNFWLKPFGSWTDQDDRNGVSGYDANTYGLVAGVDGKVSDATLLGVSFAYAKVDIDGNSSVARNSADIDVYQLMGYGSRALDANTALDFQVGFGKNMNSGEREIGFANRVAKSDYESLTATLGAGLSRAYSLGEKGRFTPSVRADYTWIQDENYHETGADALNLKVKGRDSDALILAADGKYSLEFLPATVFSANVGVGYDLLNDKDSVTSAFAGAPNAFFRTEGLKNDPWLVRAGLGLSKTVGGTELSVRYDLEHRSDFLNQSASVKARWAF